MDFKTLVEQVLSGNQDAWNNLYQMTYHKIYYTCICLVKNEQDALDMVQEAYTSAWEHLGDLKDRQQYEAWLIRIAVNKCKNLLKKTNRFYLNDTDAMEDCEEENENFLPESYAAQQEKRQLVFHIMSNVLSETLYRTVILFYFDEMTIQEIAELMECPVGTVKYRLNAARRKIKEGVLAYEQQSGEKIYSVAGIPFLALLFHYQVYGIPPMAKAAVAASVAGSVTTETAMATAGQAATAGTVGGQAAAGTVGGKAAAGQAAKIGGYAMTKALKTKIIAGIAALAVLGGAAGFIIANSDKDDNKVDNGTTQLESVTKGGDSRIVFEYTDRNRVSNEFNETVSDDMFKRYNLSYLEHQVWSEMTYNFLIPLEFDGQRLDNEAWDYHTRMLEDVTTIRMVQLGYSYSMAYVDSEYFPDSEALDIGLYINNTGSIRSWEEAFGDDWLRTSLEGRYGSEYKLRNIQSLTRSVASTDEGVNPFGFSYTLEKGTMTVEDKHEHISGDEIVIREIPYNLVRFSGLTEDDVNDWGFLYFDVSEGASKQAVMDDLSQVLIDSFKAVEWE